MEGGAATEDAGGFEGFEWDSAKSDATRAQRGFGFDAAAQIFKTDNWEHEDTRRDYGEQRYVTTGEVDGRVVTAVWTPRGKRRRIIAAWQASNRERREYREYSEEIQRRGLAGEASD